MNVFPADNADDADTRRLVKNCAANAAHGQGRVAVGLRQKALRQRFLIATTASRVFQQPVNIRVNSRPFAVKKSDPK
jgi:hypothetical protein